jgi:phage/plasmid-like protein (TIGR03299 family)
MGAIPEVMVSRLSAWHRTGNIIGEYFDIDTLLSEAALKQQVIKDQLSRNGKLIPAWGTFGVDDEQFYGTVGEDYQVIQHTEGFLLANELIGKGLKRFETAGTLFNGSVVFASASADRVLRVGNDESNLYFNFVTSHNGKYAFMLKLSAIRQVCQNTVEASISGATKAGFKVYHTKNAVLAFEDAKKGLENANKDFDNLEENLNFLNSRMVSNDVMFDIMKDLFVSNTAKGKQKMTTGSKRAETIFENKLEQILDRYEFNDGNAFPEQRGTAYNLLNAITGWVDHENKRSFEYATVGQGNDLKNRAMEVITLAANGMPAKTETKYFSVPSNPLPTMENQDIVKELLGL